MEKEKYLLLIDKYTFFAETLKTFITNLANIQFLGYFSNIKEAINYIEKNRVDIILLDFNSFKKEDIASYQLIKTKNKNLKIILYSLFDLSNEIDYDFIDAFLIKDKIFDNLTKLIN